MKQRILELLRTHKDQYLSGEELCQRFQVSRTAIWKHIKDLQEEGYQIEAVRNRGYRLQYIPDLVTSAEILNGLQTRRIGQLVIDLKSTDSTNRVAAKLADQGEPEGMVVIADSQTGGKGRRGRAWYSPPGAGIWMSLILRPTVPISQAPQITFVGAVAVSHALSELTGIKAGIKWPNDILFEQRKVCGILTEMAIESEEIKHMIMGIGINVNQEPADFPKELQATATSLRAVTGQELRRAEVVQRILEQFERLYDRFLVEGGFASIRNEWKELSITIGQRVIARMSTGTVAGIAEEIDETGSLWVRDDLGVVHKIYAADILFDV